MLANLFVGFGAFIIAGVPIAIVLGLTSIVSMIISGQYPLSFASMTVVQSLDSFSFLAIPFFILSGALMDRGGISKRLINFVSSIIGRLPGGLAVVAVVSATFFGAISGSGPATVAAIGGIMVPFMIEAGYGKGFSAAVVAAAGCIGLFIPPSIAMITYGVAAGQSIGKLFIGGVVPGLLTCLGLCIICIYISKKRGYASSEPFSWAKVIGSLKDAIWPLLMPVIILGGIYSGVFTPTESAAVACLYAVIVGFFVTRELKVKDLPQILKESAVTTSTIMLIIATAGLFGRLLTLERLPFVLVEMIKQSNMSKFMFLLVINIAMLFLGTFMELNASILILTPVLLPIAKTMGIDLIHLGVIIVVNMTFGLLTPPLGVHLFVGSSIANIKLEEVIKEILPFLAIGILVILITTYWPELAVGMVKLIK